MSYPWVHPWVLKPQEFLQRLVQCWVAKLEYSQRVAIFFFSLSSHIFPTVWVCQAHCLTRIFLSDGFLKRMSRERSDASPRSIWTAQRAVSRDWCPWTDSTGSISPAWGMGDTQSVKASNSHHRENPPALWAAHREFYTEKKVYQQRSNPAPC